MTWSTPSVRSRRCAALRSLNSELSNISFEGAKIVRVIEDSDRARLTFQLSYPIPEGGSDFPQRKLIFQCCSRYVREERMAGEPTIQRTEILDADSFRKTLRMHTDRGIREVTCSPRVLEESL